MESEKKKESAKTFLKESFLKSEEYKNKKDLISVLLHDGKYYSKSRVDSMINEYLKGCVI